MGSIITIMLIRPSSRENYKKDHRSLYETEKGLVEI